MKIWNPGEACQIRDRRDGTIVFTAKVRSQSIEPPIFEGGAWRDVVYITPDDENFPPCGIPLICVEPVGQVEKNQR